jgi:tRNA-splicing ligase RtcB (3'-phosphate/5'-hydroxy nucleic acid ligase)
MRVPGMLIGSERLVWRALEDGALGQVVNVATLPGIIGASFAMPDVHWGYGFPIGGVAATDVAAGGVVSPGGVGFDIACGVRLVALDLKATDFAPRAAKLMDALEKAVPCGLGAGSVWPVGGRASLDRVLAAGARAAVEAGLGEEADLDRTESGGRLEGADPQLVGERARARGAVQLGSLGSGNHFAEVQVVDEIFDEGVAAAFGLASSQVCVMIHCGSRGLGHQVCSDFLRTMPQAMRRFGIEVPDRQLACVPVRSPEGEDYLAAMAAAANFGWANRQALATAVGGAFRAVFGRVEMRLVYDITHNLARLEEHDVRGGRRLLCVHRKGATRALPALHPDLPAAFASTGHPVLVPGSMGTASHVLVGDDPGGAFHSCCHGAGRAMSRHAALRSVRGEALRGELEKEGVAVRARSWRGLAEEAPVAYKDVEEVVSACERAGLARRVARLRPLGVVKG